MTRATRKSQGYSLVLVCTISFLLVGQLFPVAALADIYKPGLKLRAGGFWAFIDSTLDAKVPATQIDQTLDFEGDLDLDDSKITPFVEMTYRFNDRHGVSLNYVNLDRDGTVDALAKPFEVRWNGKLYSVNAGTRLKTSLDLDLYQLTYNYNFSDNDHWAIKKWLLFGTVGVHVVDTSASFDGTITVSSGGNAISTGAQTVSEDVTAPLPDIGLLSYYKWGHGIVLGAKAQYLPIKLKDARGYLLDLRVEALKYLDDDQHLALGAAYGYYGMEMEYDTNSTRIDATVDYHGPMVFIQYDF